METTDTSLIVLVQAKIDSFMKDMDKVVDKLEKSSNKMGQIGKKMTVGVTVPLVALGGKMLDLAAEAEEMEGKFERVFGNMSGDAKKWSEDFSDSVGRSELDVKSMMSRLQNYLVGIGGTVEESYSMSQEMIERLFDLSAFHDLNDLDAFEALTSGVISGNSMALKRFDLAIDENVIKQEALRMGITKTYNELSTLEKAQIRWNVVMQQSNAVQGTVVDEADNYSSKLRALKGNLKDLGVELGEELIPMASDFVGILLDWTKGFRELDDDTKSTVVKLGGFLVILGPMLVGISKIITAITVLKGSLLKLKGIEMAKFLNAGVFTGATVAMGGLLLESSKLKKEFEDIDELLTNIDQKGFSSKFEFESEVDKVREIEEAFRKFEESAMKANMSLDYFNYSEGDKGIAPTRMKFNMNNEEKQATNDYISFLGKVYEHYKNFENLARINDLIKQGYEEQNQVLEERNEMEEEYIRLKEIQQEKQDNLNYIYDELIYLEEKNDLVIDSINLLDELSNKEKLSIQDKEDLATITSFLNTEIGKNAIEYDKNTGSIKINKELLDQYRQSLAGLVAESQNKVTIEIETILTTRENDLRRAKNELSIIEKEMNTDKGVSRDDIYRYKEKEKEIELLEKEREEAEKLEKDAEKKRDAIVQKSINRVKSSMDVQKRVRDNSAREAEMAAREADMAFQKRVRDELRLVEHRYNIEEITQKEMLDGLRNNLEKHSSYYNKNLDEQLNLIERIYNIEKDIENKRQSEQLDFLSKANDSIKEELNKKSNYLKEQHNKEIKLIEEVRDTELKALRDVFDEKKNLIDKERKELRLEEIDQVLERYENSLTADGQKKYRELLREKEDIELSFQEEAVISKEKEINDLYDLQLKSMETVHKLQEEKLKQEEKLIEENYTNIFNSLNNITEEETLKIEEGINVFKEKLTNGIEEALKTINVDTNFKDLDISFLDNISEKMKELTDNVDIVPQEIKESSLYSTNNNINVNINTINVNGQKAEETYIKDTSIILLDQLKQSLKEVL